MNRIYYALTSEGEKKLLATRDEEAINLLLQANEKRISNYVRNLLCYRSSMDDEFVEAGRRGFYHAILKFDLSFGNRLFTYAKKFMEGEVKKCDWNRLPFVVSKSDRALISKIFEVKDRLFVWKEPTPEEIAAELEKQGVFVSPEKVSALGNLYGSVSFDQDLGDGDTSLRDTIPDPNNAFSSYFQEEKGKAIGKAMEESSLTEKEKTYLRHRFCLDGGLSEPSNREISIMMGISEEAAKKLGQRSMKKLQGNSSLLEYILLWKFIRWGVHRHSDTECLNNVVRSVKRWFLQPLFL